MIPLKQFIKNILLTVYQLAPRTVKNSFYKDKVTILLYHQISPESFESHVLFLKQNYSIISLNQYKEVLYGETANGLPQNPLIITFDDGWYSNYSLLPVIMKYQVPVSIFISTGLVNTKRMIWNYTIDRKGTDLALNEQLKNESNQRKDDILREPNGHFPEREYDDISFLSLEQMKEMSSFVEFHSHGVFHPVFTQCSDSELKTELIDSKQFIERTFDGVCYGVSYPYGRFGEREVTYCKEAGYQIGRAANNPGVNSIRSDPFRLKCIGVFETTTLRELQKALAWGVLYTALRKRFGGKTYDESNG